MSSKHCLLYIYLFIPNISIGIWDLGLDNDGARGCAALCGMSVSISGLLTRPVPRHHLVLITKDVPRRCQMQHCPLLVTIGLREGKN